MDPTSFVASLITLLGAASASCEFCYNFILDISELPDEIRAQAVKIQCLKQSISDLVNLYEQGSMPAEFRMDPLLEVHIHKFVDDVQEIEAKMRRSSVQVDRSRVHRLRARLSWISSNRRMRKFYTSLDEWMRIFSAALSKTELFVCKNSPRRVYLVNPI
jgi:hypothetical protein